MKPLTVLLLLLLLALPSFAQQSEIIEFDRSHMTWVSQETNVYSAVQWTSNLTSRWHAFVTNWNMVVATPTNSLDFSGLEWGALPFRSLFFRVVCSTNPVPTPYDSYIVEIVNDGTNDVLDLEFSLTDG